MKPIVVIGGGHNGLAAALVLARSGRKVIVCEARADAGGLAARRSLNEDFHVPGLLHDTTLLRPSLLAPLGLEKHGLAWRDRADLLAGVDRDEPICIRYKDGVVEGVEDADKQSFAKWQSFMKRLSGVVGGLMDAPPPHPGGDMLPLLWTGLKIRRLGRKDMTELMRVAPMCVADWLRDLFEDEGLSAALSLDGVHSMPYGPWSAGTAPILLLREALAGREVVGGPAALIDAMLAAASQRNVEIRCGCSVTGIRLHNGAVVSVETDAGTIETDLVVAGCNPKHVFKHLIGEEWLPVDLAGDIHKLRMRGSTAKVHYALATDLTYRGRSFDLLRTGTSLDGVERAFDPIKYRELTSEPILEVRCWRGDGLAPAGSTTVSIMAHGVAHTLKEGWTEETRERLAQAVRIKFQALFPEAADKIVAEEVLTPVDLEREYRLDGGHLHHGEQAPDQLVFMRPTMDCSRYATPVGGLFLGSSGCHPGGGVRAVAGILAARAALNR